MTFDYKAAGDRLTALRLEKAAQNLQYLMKMQDEQITLENIVAALRTSLKGALNGDTGDFNAILANHTNILDATFSHFMARADGAGAWSIDNINMALKAQRQVDRTIRTWRMISETKKPGNEVDKNAPLDE